MISLIKLINNHYFYGVFCQCGISDKNRCNYPQASRVYNKINSTILLVIKYSLMAEDVDRCKYVCYKIEKKSVGKAYFIPKHFT